MVISDKIINKAYENRFDGVDKWDIIQELLELEDELKQLKEKIIEAWEADSSCDTMCLLEILYEKQAPKGGE